MTGAALRTWRRARELDQAELAAYLEVHPQTVSNWERGRTHVPPFLRHALAAFDATDAPTIDA